MCRSMSYSCAPGQGMLYGKNLGADQLPQQSMGVTVCVCNVFDLHLARVIRCRSPATRGNKDCGSAHPDVIQKRSAMHVCAHGMPTSTNTSRAALFRGTHKVPISVTCLHAHVQATRTHRQVYRSVQTSTPKLTADRVVSKAHTQV